MTRARVTCKGKTAKGTPCSAAVVAGTEYCLWHSPDPATKDKVRRLRQRGGQARTRQLAAAPGDPLDVADLDLTTPAGLVQYVARTLERLATLAFDVKVANCIGQLVVVQNRALEVSEFEPRLRALEEEMRGQRAA